MATEGNISEGQWVSNAGDWSNKNAWISDVARKTDASFTFKVPSEGVVWSRCHKALAAYCVVASTAALLAVIR